MKNKKIGFKKIMPLALAFSLAFVAVSPVVASADEGLRLGAGVKANVNAGIHVGLSGRDQEINQARNDNDNDGEGVAVGATTSAAATVSASSSAGDNRGGGHLPKGLEKKIDFVNQNGTTTAPKGWLGIFQRWFGVFLKSGTTSTTTASTTVDLVAPLIRDVHVVSGTSTASIQWNTNESASGELRYSTSSDVTASSSSVIQSSLTLGHTVDLAGLSPDTKYYFVIVATDASGNVKDSNLLSFRTKVSATSGDVTAPRILFSTVFGVKATSAQLIWITNEPSNSQVWLSTSSTVSTSGTSTAGSVDLSYFHDVSLSGLATSTQYFYAFTSTDASGNVSTVGNGSFTTSSN
ncbi:MAG: fibronectin type III domain-containing protein [Candidatus Pacebacteria bacterium]|nr:fibronectin type III domain-containing protein [Candidatus Paceibacterota bacterium]